MSPGVPNDENKSVGRAIERFRSLYNARVVAEGELRQGGPLLFQNCDVGFGGGTSTAVCESVPRTVESAHPAAWTFMLKRTGTGWAIQSVAAQ